MKPLTRSSFVISLAAAMITASSVSAEEAPISAAWKVQEIDYSYHGFTTLYDCDAFEDKMKSILKSLGAHADTRVSARGCFGNRPSRTFFVSVTLASPVPAADAKPSQAQQSQQELLKRLGVKTDFATEEFPAQWKTVDVSRERRLNIGAGDCELLEHLKKHVLPKMSVKIEEDRVRCTPNQVSLSAPTLKVSTLAALPSPDAKADATKEAAKQ